MPFKSAKQRRWMYANEPAMARRWSAEEKRVSKQDRWGNASSRGQRMVLDERVEKFQPTNSLKTLGGGIKTNFQRGVKQQKPKYNLAAPKAQKKVYQAANYAGKNRKPMGVGAGIGAIGAGGYSLMNKSMRPVGSGLAPVTGRQDNSRRIRSLRNEVASQRRRGLGNSRGTVVSEMRRYRNEGNPNPAHSLAARSAKRIDEYKDRGISKKARDYNPEAGRQRRLGAAVGGSVLGGAALATAGGRRIAANTGKTDRARAIFYSNNKNQKALREKKKIGRASDQVRGRLAAVDDKGAAMVGGGLGLMAVGGGINRYAHSSRNRKWD